MSNHGLRAHQVSPTLAMQARVSSASLLSETYKWDGRLASARDSASNVCFVFRMFLPVSQSNSREDQSSPRNLRPR